jgi:GNAT superfamily N-acetyltransferase
MLRPAAAADLPRLIAIRDGAGEDALSDPVLIDEADLRRLIASGAVTVWDDSGDVAGVAVLDGGAIYVLVDAIQRSRGVGRALLAWACDSLSKAGHTEAMVTLPPGGSAERHYLAAGWNVAGRSATGGTVLKKPL